MKTCTPRLTVTSTVSKFPSVKEISLIFLLFFVNFFNSEAQTPCIPILDCPSSRVVSCADAAANPWGDPGYKPEFVEACSFNASQLTAVPWPSRVNDCDSIYSSVIIRMWSLPGFPSLCSDTTYVARVNILSESLICPSGRDTVICGIDPGPLSDITLRAPMYQIPGVDTFALYDTSSICGVYVSVSDMEWPSCGNTKTVMRTWLLHDECGRDTVCYDTIVYVDNVAPTVSFDTMSLSTELHDIGAGDRLYLTDTIGMAPSGCVGHGLAPYATVTDNCSDPEDIDISVLGVNNLALLHYKGNQVISLPLWNIQGDKEALVYTSTDGCGNTRNDTIVLVISDQTPATAVCHDKVNLSLTNVDQFSFMKAGSMDAESHDNCAIYQILARRTDWMTACGYDDTLDSAIKDYYDHFAEWVQVDPGICQDIYEYGFTPDVPFCCEDVGKEIMVEILVIDFNCNVDRCWGVVNVEDKLPPMVVQNLPDITITCNAYVEFYQDMFEAENTGMIQSHFGKYVVDLNDRQSFMVQDLLCSDPLNPVSMQYLDGLLSDNCGGSFAERYTLPEDDCANNFILREFIATVSTDHGAQDLVFASQHIYINKCPLNLMDISLSMYDTVVYDCGFTYGIDGNVTIETPGPQLPHLVPGCGNYGVGFFDKIFEVVNGVGCYKIQRTWCVVDWCQVRGGGDWSMLAKEPGSISFNQYIKIVDTIAPTIQEISMVADIQTASCSGVLSAQINATDNCGDPAVSWELRTQLGQFVAAGIGEIAEPNQLLAPDAYKLRWLAEDPCGNVSELVSEFTISSNAKPSLVAKTAITTTLTPMDSDNDGLVDLGMAEVWAAEFNSSSAPACGGNPDDLIFLVAQGFADETSTVPSDDATALQFTCADFTSDPTMIPVQFWAKDQSTGVADYLNVMVLLYDNSSMCSPTQAPQSVSIISGQINTENQEQIPDVAVKVSNGVNETVVNTGDAGLYQAGIPLVDHTMIKPEKNNNHAHGISTADLIKVQKHILGIKSIESPYKMIAADVNRDGHINPIDLIQMRKVLLGKIEKFPDNTSWRFVDAAYHFAKEDRALEEDFPEQIELNSSTGREAKKNFVGIKIGDLNGNVFAAQATNRSRSETTILVPDQNIVANHPIKVPVFLTEALEIEGIQLQFHVDVSQIEIINVETGQLHIDRESIKLTDEGILLSLTLANGALIDVDKPLFYLNINPKRPVRLMNTFTLSDQGFSSEVYESDQEASGLQLVFSSESSENHSATLLMQNRPNPFRAETIIEFRLNEAQRVGLKIYDLAGRVLKDIDQYFSEGLQQVTVDKSELTPGILYYELQTNQGRETKRMILLE